MEKTIGRETVMQQLLALAQNKKLLGAAVLLILGTTILVFWILGGSIPTSPGAEVATFVDDQAAALEETAPEPESSEIQTRPNTTPTAMVVIIYISGAVQRPDVYQVPATARVKDVVLAAGGLTEDAAIDEINLAERLADAQHIHIRRQGETAASAASSEDNTQASKDGPLNLNTASAADLDGLPGIGQSIAERIVEYRTTNGPFQSVEDLQKVKGVGPALFAKLEPLVAIGP
jgi:competence protein ComEA